MKIGDKYYFFSIYTYNIWEDTIIRITPSFVYFKNHPKNTGEYRVTKEVLTTNMADGIALNPYAKFGKGNDTYNDYIFVDQNKDVLKEQVLIFINKIKRQKQLQINNKLKEHHSLIEEFGKVESTEQKVKSF